MVCISGTGVCTVDYLYTKIDFSSPAFKKYESKHPGDGGVRPGHLSFVDAWERFAGVSISQIQQEQGWAGNPDKSNLGGPCIVALVNAAQLLEKTNTSVKYFGARANDAAGEVTLSLVKQTPVDVSNYRCVEGTSSFCVCLSDPNYNMGKGERCFAINIGALASIVPSMLDESFFASDILYFGATALTPGIHKHLAALLRKGKEMGRITVVGTVFDHASESRDSVKRWPMGESDESFKFMDLLMMDWDEARRISGEDSPAKMKEFFSSMGVKSFSITHGPESTYVWSDGTLFRPLDLCEFPISERVVAEMKRDPSLRGDTTGCGDNFAGGVLAYIAEAMTKGKRPGELDFAEAMSWAVASGGFACFTVGGTYFEKRKGEKRRLLEVYQRDYLRQIEGLGRKKKTLPAALSKL